MLKNKTRVAESRRRRQAYLDLSELNNAFSVEDLIKKIRNRENIHFEEFNSFIKGCLKKKVTKKQLSDFLISIKKEGLSDEGVLAFFRASFDNSNPFDLPDTGRYIVDKHSTGGIGDKATMILLPLIYHLGLGFFKFTGKTLGHTGGTADKLLSFPEFNLNFSSENLIKKFVKDKEIIALAPNNNFRFEKESYEVRTANDTVQVVELIAASIFVKKLAVGTDFLIIDVKFGVGSLFKDLTSLKRFVELGRKICDEHDVNYDFIFSNMNQPLGHAIGNKIEVLETINTLRGKGPNDVVELVTKTAAKALVASKMASSEKEASEKIAKVLESGAALESFRHIIESQGKKWDAVINSSIETKYKIDILAEKDGYVFIINNLEVGNFLNELNGFSKDRELDREAGIYWIKKNNNLVKKGDTVLVFYTNIDNLDKFKKKALSLFVINDSKTELENLIYENENQIRRDWKTKIKKTRG